MSSEATPISPARFAEAIQELSLTTLHLKVLEIRNEIAHLDYSNEQLLPYAKGTAAVIGASSQQPAPDPDCAEAIQENLVVIDRKLDQLRLVRAEVESRGVSWTEFQSKEEAEQQAAEAAQRAERTSAALAGARQPAAANATNGTNGTNGTDGTDRANGHAAATDAAASTAGNPWTDGTFQTGRIRNGTLHMDPVGGGGSSGSSGGGGSLTDEQLRRALEERLGLPVQSAGSGSNGPSHANGGGDDADDEGLHL